MKPERLPDLSPPWTATSLSVDVALARVFARKWILVFGGILGILFGTVIGVMSTRLYEATVTIAPAKTNGAEGAAMDMKSNLGALAAMVGMPFPGAQGDNASINLAYLKSRQFGASFIQQHGMMKLFYPKDNGVGGREVHTMGDAVRYFDKKVRSVKKDRSTGLIVLSVDWRDRFQAAQWANEMVTEINEQARNRAISEAQRSLKYLNIELQKTSVVELRNAIYRLMEQNIKSIMLANAHRDFAFEVIDPAMVPDANRYVRPNWLFNTIAGFIIGVTMGALAALLMRPKEMDASQNSDVRLACARDRELAKHARTSVDREYKQ